MPTSLSTKYRPVKFNDLVNQEHIKTTLQNQIESSKLGHAYIFCGGRGLGKTTVARLLARAINCEKKEKGKSEPCGKCESCLEVSEGNALDLIEIDAASHTGVDNVRENIIASARVSPSKRKYKVFIIDEVHMLSTSAFNALLKTIEEPPGHVIFVLATTEIHKVPETIISRCQRFDFRKVGVDDIIKRLKYILKKEDRDVEDSVLFNIGRHAEGSIRDAESTLSKVLALGGKKIKADQAEIILPRTKVNLSLDFLMLLSDKKADQAIGHLNMLVEDGVDLQHFTQDTIELARKLMLLKIDEDLKKFSYDLDKEIEKGLTEIIDNFSLEEITYLINNLLEKRGELKYADIPQLPLEIAVIEICNISTKPIENIEQKTEIEEVRESSEVLVEQKTETTKEAPKEEPEKEKKEEKQEKSKPSPELEAVQSKWSEIITQLKSYNHSLSFVLKMCEPIEVKKDKLKLGVKYKLHQERLNQKNIRRILEEVVGKIMDKKIRIEAVMMDEKSDGFIKNVINVFGGKVVE